MRDTFDVFFSYSTSDHVSVERVALGLHDRGVRVFLDRWYLAAGQPWPRALEQTLDSCNAVAVFIGAGGLGPWQQRERDLALDRQGREAGFPVIPVLLAGSDPALGFLKLNTWVDLSAGPGDDAALDLLVAAIRREPPGPLARQRTDATRGAVCPYRGLRPFREEDEPFFFGRAAFTETLAATLDRQSFVAVVGASGSGKSSVVRAGLIPRLRRDRDKRVWEAVSFVPTDRPLASLAAALLPLLEPDLSEIDRLTEVGKLARGLADGQILLRDVTDRILAKQPGTERLLLFADQWEELYTLCSDEANRSAFVLQLLEVARSAAVSVVLTVRGDFYGRALSDRALSDQLQDAVVNIGPMTRDELAETVIRPAEKTDLIFEPGLVETILDDVGEEPGNLPLLEFLLEALWNERQGAVLHYDAYQKLGRVAGAIAHRADEVFTRELDDSQREAAQRLLIRMVRPGEGVEDTRQRSAMPFADPVAEATIRKLADARLVVTERDAASGRETVEVAHEALIQRWQLLRGWVDQDREFLRTRERISAQARPWEDEGRLPDRLLPPGRPLAEGEDLLATRRADLEPGLAAYIEVSIAAAKAKKDSAAAAQRRRVRVARLVAAAMVVLAFAAIAGGSVGWWQRAEAQRNAEEAQRNASRALASLAENEAENGSPATAIRLALAALPMRFDQSDRAYARVAEGALLYGLQQLRERRRLLHETQVSSVVFSPDGRSLATGARGTGTTVRIWEAGSGQEVAALRGHFWVSSVAFSADGRMLATGSFDGTASLWEVASSREIGVLRGHMDHVYSVAFSPDGRTLATGSADHTARLWDVASGREIAGLRHEAEVSSVAFSPNGRNLATASTDKTARLWEAASGKQIAVLRGHEALGVVSVTFSPDGRMLATGSGDNTARLWEAASGREIAVLRGHDDTVTSVSFSPDGQELATGSRDRTVRLWEAASGRGLGILYGHGGDVSSVAFSPDGRTLATGSADHTARLWDMASGREIPVLRGHEAHVSSVAFSPDGRILATGSGSGLLDSVDNTARLWEVASGTEIAVLRGHKGLVGSVAFGPDGRTLATGSYDKTARLWEAGTGREIAVLRHEGDVSSVAFSPDGRTLATGSNDTNARLWDVASGQEMAVLRGHNGSVEFVAFSPDGRTLATGSVDDTARLWDVTSGREIAVLRGHEDEVSSVAFSPDGQTLATGSGNTASEGATTPRLWEVATGKEIGVLRGHKNWVGAVAFSPDGRTLATGSGDKTARMWEVTTGREIAILRHTDWVSSVAFSPDGRTLATASWDDTVRLWPLGQRLIDLACARVQELPPSEHDKQRFGIENEWCSAEVSADIRAKLEERY